MAHYEAHSDLKVGSGGGTACELENSKNPVFEAVRGWYHLDIVSQVVVPPNWAVVPPSVNAADET